MLSLSHLPLLLPALFLYLFVRRILDNLFFHRLSSFPAPFYLRLSSLPLALISLFRREPEFLFQLSKKYPPSTRAIRISPNLLFFPHASALKSIYWSSTHNHKGSLYGTGALGPTSLFSTLPADDHKTLRKSLGGAHWSVSYLKNEQEPRIDSLVTSFVAQLRNFSEQSPRGEAISMGDKLAQFAADVMTLLVFGKPWGFIAHDRDEKRLLAAFRESLPLFSFAARCTSFRELILSSGLIRSLILPKMDDKTGSGYLASQGKLAVARREKERDEQLPDDGAGVRDYLDYTLDARDSKGEPLTRAQKEAHVTLLIQAGADTTGSALGSILRFILQDPDCLEKVEREIRTAEERGLLSTPVLYEETKQHLPYFVACIKEGLRLNPPAPNLFGRVILEKGGTVIDGVHVPQGAEVCSDPYTVGRDPEMYGPGAEAFRPERWLGGDEKRKAELEAASFVFSMGPRVCLGKEIAYMEMYKVLPEIVRRFEFDVVEPGKYVDRGGVAYNRGFKVLVRRRN
ncbi:putative cytochrome P450 E-class, group I [Triangularia verruculosa]|uniref:Cytochrome P450 E-class, group I n=1 Tax=Triangularia verruculosa TaxID=2587418 RepID=A0AAN7AYZ6_9PEZI|nr:putative cytochrome P450 E-class, group I [Triangularia verruculosa]